MRGRDFQCSHGDTLLSVSLLYGADCRESLRNIKTGSVHCCITSPPYWNLRDYGVASQVWGGDPDCDHWWDGSNCPKCGAWSGQLGLEPTPDLYVQHLVEVFREVRRVLHPSGTLWLNLGNSYMSHPAKNFDNMGGESGCRIREDPALAAATVVGKPRVDGLKSKDLVGTPWMVAFALRVDGWWLRSEIIWAKPNPFPSSVSDRPTTAHEHVFLLAPNEHYFYDAEAIREQGTTGAWDAMPPIGGVKHLESTGSMNPTYSGKMPAGDGKHHKRTVWPVATEAYEGAHFAVWPPALVEPMVLAGTSQAGCCPVCHTPWQRGSSSNRARKVGDWSPVCLCPSAPPVPCTVLDPFSGSGTTGLVATQNGRSFIGLDLNEEYLDLAESRIRGAAEKEDPTKDWSESAREFFSS